MRDVRKYTAEGRRKQSSEGGEGLNLIIVRQPYPGFLRSRKNAIL